MDSENNYKIIENAISIEINENNQVIEEAVKEEKEVEEKVEVEEVEEETVREEVSLEEIRLQTSNIIDNTDKRVTTYLINELEKKIQYINELEDILKFQEQEILSLKNKLESANKMQLLIKLKNNIDTKSEELSNKIILEESKKDENSSQESNDFISLNKKPEIKLETKNKLEVIKSVGTNIDIISNVKTPQIIIEKTNNIDTIKLRRRARHI